MKETDSLPSSTPPEVDPRLADRYVSCGTERYLVTPSRAIVTAADLAGRLSVDRLKTPPDVNDPFYALFRH